MSAIVASIAAAQSGRAGRVERAQPAGTAGTPLPLDVLVTRQNRLTDEPANVDHAESLPFFIDWLTLYQEHEGIIVNASPVGPCQPTMQPLPIVSAGVVWATDAGGELKWKTIKPSVIEGSHETSVQVRCDGHKVTFAGNVSRFGRADNVFGFSLGRCLSIVNGILAGLGLPPFTPGDKFYRTVRGVHGASLRAAWTGCHITRIDLTANYEAGSLSNARAYLEWLASQQTTARIKVGTHGDGETVDWGRGSRALYSKAYLKSAELAHHKGDPKLIDHCERVGLVRFEVTVKATWLHNAGMNYLGGLDMGELVTLFHERSRVLTRAEHTVDDLETVPNHFRRTARDWLAGDDVRKHLSLATFKRHRKALLPYGIDIAVKRNVVEFKPRVRTIEVRPAAVPSWYDFQRKAA